MASAKQKSALIIGLLLLFIGLALVITSQNEIDYWESPEGQAKLDLDGEAEKTYQSMLLCKTTGVLLLLLGIVLVVIYLAANRYF